ncbi:MAG: PEP-CTERM sorting domain-containing protein [Planctomycetota bacterium]|jgi:hypothetical protein
MRTNGWVQFAFLLLVVSLYAQSASALPVEISLEDQHTETFNIAGGTVTVESTAYSYETGGDFLYTYEILNESDVGLSFFSVGIVSGSDAFNCSFEGTGVVDPAIWALVGSPVQSVDGLFIDTIDNDGLSSALLYFDSSHAPTMGSAVLFGTMSGVGYSSSGDVLAPSALPEPVSILLFGFGGAVLTLGRKKRHS